jgi:hypothetical protein
METTFVRSAAVALLNTAHVEEPYMQETVKQLSL